MTPPNGKTFDVGPWASDAECADTLGSALYSHPFACHTDPSPYNCRITGNGFMYPKDAPFPIPADYPIQYTGCTKLKPSEVLDPKKTGGWYFFFYSPAESGVFWYSKYAADEKLADTVAGDSIGFYRNYGCPGAPFFSIGEDTACN